MRLGMLMRDTEYRDAMIEMISELDKDVLIEIADASGASRDAVIVTDISPDEVASEILERISVRTLFLTPGRNQSGSRDGIHTVFKHAGLTAIMAEITMVYYEWTGDAGAVSTFSTSIAVCSEYDTGNSFRCLTLARQIIYRHGGTVLILPLGFINDYHVPADDSPAAFRRLMYCLDTGRDYPAESFVFTDSYGISYLRLGDGPNPVAYLDDDYLERLTGSMGGRFDTLIMDAGTSYRKENSNVIRNADSILFFGNGRRIPDWSLFIGERDCRRTVKIGIMNDTDETMLIDEYVRDLYGIKDRTSISERTGAQVRK